MNRRSFIKSVAAILALAPLRAARVKSAEEGFRAVGARRAHLLSSGFVFCPYVPLWVTSSFSLGAGGKELLVRSKRGE